MARRSYSQKYLEAWWRKAVKAVWGDACARCGAWPAECHHVVRRAKGVLRWDWRNGIPLCKSCHAWAASLEGRRWVESMVDMDYLTERDVLLKEYLAAEGMSRLQFQRRTLEELKKVAT